MNLSLFLSRKLTHFFVQNNVIPADQEKAYEFCFDSVIGFVMFSLFLLLFGIMIGAFPYALLFLITFVPLKKCAGGAHALTRTLCTLLSYGYACISLLLVRYDPVFMNRKYFSVVFLLCLLSINGLAPVDTRKHPLSPSSKKKLKKCCLMISSLMLLLFFFFYYLNNKKSLFLLTLSCLVIAGNQYIELIQKGVQRK